MKCSLLRCGSVVNVLILLMGISCFASEVAPVKVFGVLKKRGQFYYLTDVKRRQYELKLAHFEVSQRRFINRWFVDQWIEVFAYDLNRTLVPAQVGYLRATADATQASTTVFWNFTQLDLLARNVPHFQMYPELSIPVGAHYYEKMHLDSSLLDVGEYDQFVVKAKRIKEATIRMVSQYDASNRTMYVNMLVIRPPADDKVHSQQAIVASSPSMMRRHQNGRLIWLQLVPHRYVKLPDISTEVVDQDDQIVFEGAFNDGFVQSSLSRLRVVKSCGNLFNPRRPLVLE